MAPINNNPNQKTNTDAPADTTAYGRNNPIGSKPKASVQNLSAELLEQHDANPPTHSSLKPPPAHSHRGTETQSHVITLVRTPSSEMVNFGPVGRAEATIGTLLQNRKAGDPGSQFLFPNGAPSSEVQRFPPSREQSLDSLEYSISEKSYG